MSRGIGDGPRTVVLVSGGGTNLQAIIDRVVAGQLGIRLDAVISDRPGVRALDRARQAGVPAVTVDYAGHRERAGFDAALADAILRHDPVVLAGFCAFPTPAWSPPSRRMNVHPSLLPRYPGPIPPARSPPASAGTARRCTRDSRTRRGPRHPPVPRADPPGDDEASLKERVQRAST